MRIILNYARLSDPSAAVVARALDDRGFQVVGTMSHRREDPARFGPRVTPFWWHDYSPEVFALPWPSRDPLSEIDEEQVPTLLSLVQRAGPGRSGGLEAFSRARADVVRADHLLRALRPDGIVSLDLPESGLDLSVALLARQRGIPSLWNRIGMTSYSHIRVSDAFGLWIAADGAVAGHVMRSASTGARKQEVAAIAEEALAALGSGGTRDPFVQLSRSFPVIRRTALDRIRSAVSARVLSGSDLRDRRSMAGGHEFLLELLDEYRQVQARHDDAALVGAGATCLIALHYQPELASTTLAGWAAHQFDAIKLLSDHLPEGWSVVVKEHPATFRPGSKTSSTFRPRGIYRRIASLPRVRLLPIETDVRPILVSGRVRLVATIAGTIGKEALALGVPVLHFGRAPFANFPGAAYIRTPDPDLLRREVGRVTSVRSAEIAAGFIACSRALEAVSFHHDFRSSPEGPIAGMVASIAAALPEWDPAIQVFSS